MQTQSQGMCHWLVAVLNHEAFNLELLISAPHCSHMVQLLQEEELSTSGGIPRSLFNRSQITHTISAR